MNSVTNALPTKDEHTTYDYSVGAARVSAVGRKDYRIEYVSREERLATLARLMNNPCNEQLREAVHSSPRYMYKKAAIPQLKVTYLKNGGTIVDSVNALTRGKTIEYANKTVVKWGQEAEKVLSATSTGCLYWNVLHHFGSFADFPHKRTEEKEHVTPVLHPEDIRKWTKEEGLATPVDIGK